MLLTRASISRISRIIPTGGSRPAVVLAEGFNDYVCKYDVGSKLVNEYLAHQFLQLWELEVFPAAFVQISQNHVPQEILGGTIQRHLFDKPCFGLEYDDDALSANDILIGLSGDRYEVEKFTGRFNLMDIGLFDLWLANNDRNDNNSNLLIKDNRFIAIDHSDIFDGNGLGRKLSDPTWEDSLLSSEIAKVFLNSKGRREARHKELLEQFPIFVERCSQALPGLIAAIPDEWCNDKDTLLERIRSSVIDNPVWLDQTVSTFSELIHNFNVK